CPILSAAAHRARRGVTKSLGERALLFPTEHAHVAVQSLERKLRAALSDADGSEAIRAVSDLAIAALRYRSKRRQWHHVKIGVQTAIKRLQSEVGGQIARKSDLDLAIYRFERRSRFRVRGKGRSDAPINGLGASRTAN